MCARADRAGYATGFVATCHYPLSRPFFSQGITYRMQASIINKTSFKYETPLYSDTESVSFTVTMFVNGGNIYCSTPPALFPKEFEWSMK